MVSMMIRGLISNEFDSVFDVYDGGNKWEQKLKVKCLNRWFAIDQAKFMDIDKFVNSLDTICWS